ncbi:MAG: discoidin domain-containing protein, partial [Victivallales bacterium]|nr:discoidin domain-containing protein [Victivallales bacterium]
MKFLLLLRHCWHLPLLFVLFSFSTAASGRSYAQLEYWHGGEGLAPSTPKVEIVDSPVGSAVQATVQVAGRYQGLGLELPEDVDLSQVDAIEFDFFQDARPGMKGDGSLLLDYAEGNGLYINFKYGRTPWSHVSIPMDVRTLKSLSNQAPVAALGMARRLMFSLYGELKEPGQRIAVANLTFTPRRQASAPIHVAEYHYLAEPTSGDDLETTLTDGVVDKGAQAYWREYATDPDIVFDLGGLFLVDGAMLSCVAVPSQNIAGVSFQTSVDGKEWRTAAYLKNENASGTEASYTVAGENLEMSGRFVRVKINRSRTDFQVRLAEVSFRGRLPSEEELTAIARKNYDLGPELPPLDEENFLLVADGNGGSLWLCRANGVACHWEKNGQVVVERLFQTYERTVVNPVRADAYSDVVESINATEDVAVVRTTNPALPGYTFTATWKLTPERLVHTLAIETDATGREPFYPSLQAVLPPEVRAGGLYETWGA